MNLFKRKQNTTGEAPAMPPELNDYYQAEKRQQTVVTWLLGFATLAVTVAIAFGLFLSARWIVQKVRNTPAKTPVTSQEVGVNKDKGQTTTPTPSTNPTTPTESSTGASNTAGQSTQTSTGPKTSSAVTSLPNTGPAETLAVFFVATAVGTFAYSRRTRQV